MYVYAEKCGKVTELYTVAKRREKVNFNAPFFSNPALNVGGKLYLDKNVGKKLGNNENVGSNEIIE